LILFLVTNKNLQKMNMLKVTLKRNVLLASCLVFGLGTVALGQNAPQISTRFTHPQYDAPTRTYTLDVEMQASGAAQKLFGMNVRFFYDASELEFLSLSELHPSYGILGEAPKAFTGNSNSGYAMFNFESSAGYVNGAVQLVKEDAPMEVLTNQWTKFFKARFKVPATVPDGSRLCPSVIWDLKADAQAGGFFPGDNGVVITVAENNPQSREVSGPARVNPVAFNWENLSATAMPYGRPLNSECLSIGGVSTASHEVAVDEKGYALYQNYPNPFSSKTMIEFILPEALEAKLIFCDVTGRLVHQIEGDYKAGHNAVNVQRGAWSVQGNVLFYRLETSDYTSEVRKMTLVNE